jgi:hypothetical protein
MNMSQDTLREIMIAAAIAAAVLSVGGSMARARGVSQGIVSVLHYSGYGLMFVSIIIFIMMGASR